MTEVPKTVKIISILGLLPFFLGVLATFKFSFINSDFNKLIVNISIMYGALILSFLGGSLFGFESLNNLGPNNRRLWYAIIPTIWALLAVQIPIFSASALAVGFLLVYEFDRKANLAGLVPNWWLSLRFPLTATVVLSLIVIGFFDGN